MFVAIRVVHVRSLRRFAFTSRVNPFVAVVLLLTSTFGTARAGLTLKSGDIVVSYTDRATHGIARLDTSAGALDTISTGGQLTDQTDLDVAADGTIYATNAHSLLRIDPRTGAQQIVSSGGLINEPNSIVLRGGSAILAQYGGHGVVRVDLATGAQTNLSSLSLYGMTNEPGTGALLAYQLVHIPLEDGIDTGVALVRVSPRTGRRHSVIQEPTVDFRDGLGVGSDGQIVIGTMPLETGSGGTDFEKLDPVTGEGRFSFNPYHNPKQPFQLYVSDLAVDAQDNVVGTFFTSTAMYVPSVAEIVRFSLHRAPSDTGFETLFTHPQWDGVGNEGLTYSLDHIALAPAGVAAAIPLPRAAGAGLVTLVLALCFVRGRRRAVSARRPC